MPIRITCSDCGKTLKVPERLAGKKGRCPGCQAVVSIPTPAETFEREIDPPTKRQRPQQRATTPESTSDDEFGFLDDPALEEDDAESTYSVGSTAPSLPPRTVGGGKQKQPGKTFQAAIEERGPKRQTYKEFTSVDAEPAGRRDHLFFVFMLALIPLAWSIFLPQETVADRVIQQIEEADGDPDQLDAEEIAELFADRFVQGQPFADGIDFRKQRASEVPVGHIPPDKDCAKAVYFLLSDYASEITGAALDVNGGDWVAI